MRDSSPLISRFVAFLIFIAGCYGLFMSYLIVPQITRANGIRTFQRLFESAPLHSDLTSPNHQKSITLPYLTHTKRPLEGIPFPPLDTFPRKQWKPFLRSVEQSLEIQSDLEQETLSDYTLQQFLSTLSSTQRTEFQKKLELLRSTRAERDSMRAKLNSARERRLLLAQQIELLRADIARAFALKLPEVKGDKTTLLPSLSEESFYSDGLLRGLPRMKGIPDGIKDTSALRELLTQLNPDIFSAASPAEDLDESFQYSLSTIRITAEQVRATLRELESEQKNLNSLLKAARNSELEQRVQIYKLMARNIRSIDEFTQ